MDQQRAEVAFVIDGGLYGLGPQSEGDLLALPAVVKRAIQQTTSALFEHVRGLAHETVVLDGGGRVMSDSDVAAQMNELAEGLIYLRGLEARFAYAANDKAH